MNQRLIIVSIICLFQFIFSQRFTNQDRYFSPNLDGNKDVINIPFVIKDESLKKWSFFITKKEGNIFKKVKTFESKNPKEEQLTFKKFFSRIIAKDSPLESPDSFLWEGHDDQGNLVEDGIYYFTIVAIDQWDNRSQSPFIPIIVDMVTPISDFSLVENIFSPNQDNRIHSNSNGATEYICVDANPETVHGGGSSQAGRLLYPVEARCGSLKCPPYVNNRELTCVVCSR